MRDNKHIWSTYITESEIQTLKELLAYPEEQVPDLYKLLQGVDELITGAYGLGYDEGQSDEFLDALEEELQNRYPGHSKRLMSAIKDIMSEAQSDT